MLFVNTIGSVGMLQVGAGSSIDIHHDQALPEVRRDHNTYDHVRVWEQSALWQTSRPTIHGSLIDHYSWSVECNAY